MVQVANQENLCLDVVSEGELYTALQAGFPTEKIHLHGNNKSRQEIEMAIDHNIGCIVIENGQEKLVVRCETYQDVVKNDLSYE